MNKLLGLSLLLIATVGHAGSDSDDSRNNSREKTIYTRDFMLQFKGLYKDPPAGLSLEKDQDWSPNYNSGENSGYLGSDSE